MTPWRDVTSAALPSRFCFVLKFKRQAGEQEEEEADLWVGYCAFHLGDYKRALEVRGDREQDVALQGGGRQAVSHGGEEAAPTVCLAAAATLATHLDRKAGESALKC